jgi:hypothetical protein
VRESLDDDWTAAGVTDGRNGELNLSLRLPLFYWTIQIPQAGFGESPELLFEFPNFTFVVQGLEADTFQLFPQLLVDMFQHVHFVMIQLNHLLKVVLPFFMFGFYRLASPAPLFFALFFAIHTNVSRDFLSFSVEMEVLGVVVPQYTTPAQFSRGLSLSFLASGAVEAPQYLMLAYFNRGLWHYLRNYYSKETQLSVSQHLEVQILFLCNHFYSILLGMKIMMIGGLEGIKLRLDILLLTIF